MTAGRDAHEDPRDDEDDYVREEIPDERVEDLAGREVHLRRLADGHAALLLYAPPGTEAGRRILQSVPALLVGVPHLHVHTVLTDRSELVALPPEARRQAIFDSDRRTHQSWGIEPGAVGAVLLGIDGLLAGGPVLGLEAVECLANDVRDAIVGASPDPVPPDRDAADRSFSVDVLIPFRNAAPERLRNLAFTIGYYRRHLPTARIILAEHEGPTPLPEGVTVDLHLSVSGDEDLFNKSLLLNEASRHASASTLVFADVDCIPEVWVLAALEGLSELLWDTYVVPHTRVHYLTAASSAEFIAGQRDHDGPVGDVEKHTEMVTVGGVTFCSAELFKQMGGFDQQRFLGWGGEDDDLYDRCLVSGRVADRIPSDLLHLDHPGAVWHSFTEAQMTAKRSRIPAPNLRSPADRVATVQSFMRHHRVGLATCSASPALFAASRDFSARLFPDIYSVDGTGGTYGAAAFRAMFADPRLAEYDYLIYTDEDDFIVDWPALQQTMSAFIEGGYGFAGMPDGGVISHRFHNPIAINPFLALFDLRAVREALHGVSELDGQFGPDLIGHWPGGLVRAWKGEAHPRVQRVLEEGYLPYGASLDMFEPHYSLWFHLLRRGLRPLCLDARDAPEMDDDGCCTALLGIDGTVMAYHSWFGRAYGRDRAETMRINKVHQRALSHLRW